MKGPVPKKKNGYVEAPKPGPFEEHTFECEACDTEIHARICRGATGRSDFLSVTWPEEAWIGWVWADVRKSDLRVTGFCSAECMRAKQGQTETPQ